MREESLKVLKGNPESQTELEATPGCTRAGWGHGQNEQENTGTNDGQLHAAGRVRGSMDMAAGAQAGGPGLAEGQGSSSP